MVKIMTNVILALLVVSSFGCAPEHKKTNSFDSEACSPPCWNRIEPGKTTEEELDVLIAGLDGIEKSSVSKSIFLDGTERVSWSYQNGEGGVAYITESRVLSVGVMDVKGIKFADMVEKYGEPDRLFVHERGGDCINGINAAAIYSNKGIIAGRFECAQSPPSQYKMRENSNFEYILFFYPSNMEVMLRTVFLRGENSALTKTAVQSWPGFNE